MRREKMPFGKKSWDQKKKFQLISNDLSHARGHFKTAQEISPGINQRCNRSMPLRQTLLIVQVDISSIAPCRRQFTQILVNFRRPRRKKLDRKTFRQTGIFRVKRFSALFATIVIKGQLWATQQKKKFFQLGPPECIWKILFDRGLRRLIISLELSWIFLFPFSEANLLMEICCFPVKLWTWDQLVILKSLFFF